MRMDFSSRDFRGRSFKGVDLSGADFTEADIRGANFTYAVLRGAKFMGAKAGLQRRWATALVICSWLLSGLSGILSGLAVSSVLFLFATSNLEYSLAGFTSLIVLVVFFSVTIRQGLVAALGTVVVIGTFAGAFTGAVAAAVGATGGSVTRAFAIAGAIAGVVAGGVAEAIAVAVAGSVAVTTAVTVAGVVALALAGGVAGAVAVAGSTIVTVAISVAISVSVTLVSTYIGWRAIAGDEKYAFIRGIAITFAATGGTSFRCADLTDADFRSATLKSTDFRRAKLTRTRWYHAKKLDHVRPGTTYLKDAKVRLLLITGQGQDQNFDHQPLRGVNLQGANLQDASLIGADLSEANLQDADLSRAKLKQTQVDMTDFTGATLTGAYIEDWGITGETKLDGVRCEYIFMRVPTKEDPDPCRKPDNKKEVFEDGDFADFIKPIVRTLDLYHSQDVDPRAIAISFKELAENHPEAELRIVGTEVRGEDKFLLRAETATSADKSELSVEYFSMYNHIKALVEQEIQAQITEKDSRIRSLETMVVTALKRHSFYSETYYNQGDTMSEAGNTMSEVGGRVINISSVSGITGGNLSGIIVENELNDIVSDTINEVSASPEPDKLGLKEPLIQLQAAIETEPHLQAKEKVEALEQLEVLAEAGKNPQDEVTQKLAKSATKILNEIVANLPSDAKLVESCEELLPAITKFLEI